jgi:DNA polymerase-4
MRPTKVKAFAMPLNKGRPLIMHVDMNSCYATMEQQSNPMLRDRPVAVCAYTKAWGAVISPSVEAKQAGVKLGMRVIDAQRICPDIAIIQMYPPLYMDAHMRFKRIFKDYSPNVYPKSVDEAVIDFSGTPAAKGRDLESIGREIKQRIRDEIGEWVRVNVGIATNQCLAKLAAGFNKPDGLTIINHLNLVETLNRVDLIELPGINRRYKARLWMAGIHSPVEFLESPMWRLKHEVFQSINGYYWYLRLRGWELDSFPSRRKSYSNNNTLQVRTNDWQVLRKFVMKLCEKTGRRLRRGGWAATCIHVSLSYEDHSRWHLGMKVSEMYTTYQIFYYAMKLFDMQPSKHLVPRRLEVSVSELIPFEPQQLGLFDSEHGDYKSLSKSLDAVNDRYGDLVVGSALLEGMDGFILNRIAFGSVKDVQDLYES